MTFGDATAARTIPPAAPARAGYAGSATVRLDEAKRLRGEAKALADEAEGGQDRRYSKVRRD